MLKEYEELALRCVWEFGGEGANSGDVWRHVNEKFGEGRSVSRASYYIFLNRMVDQGVFSFKDSTGKGGHHRVYVPKLDEAGYKKLLLRTMIDSMIRDFPEETLEVLKEYQDA